MIPLVFAHAAGAGPEDHVLPALRRVLGAGYAITAPDLGPPDAATWSRLVKAALAAAPDGAMLVGHSLGGSHLLKCVAELGPALRPRGFVGLGVPLWGQPGWISAEFALPAYAPEALAHLPIRLFQDPEDDIVSGTHLAAWQAVLPHARGYPAPDQGHLFKGDLSAVALAIAEL